MSQAQQALELSTAVQTALDHYAAVGWGGQLPEKDLEAVHDFVISTLHRTAGIDLKTAIKLVHMIEGGNWSKGWDKGYGSAKNHYSPRFSLDGGS